jgi:hypothetical protein
MVNEKLEDSSPGYAGSFQLLLFSSDRAVKADALWIYQLCFRTRFYIQVTHDFTLIYRHNRIKRVINE